MFLSGYDVNTESLVRIIDCEDGRINLDEPAPKSFSGITSGGAPAVVPESPDSSPLAAPEVPDSDTTSI